MKLIWSCMILMFLFALVCAQPLTYQGYLREMGRPANGTYDFRFRLFDAPSGGSPIGANQFADDMLVQNGLFTTPIDFGSVWDGSDRYLEIAVRPGSSADAYTALSPRVKINPTPYAVTSMSTNALPGRSVSSDVPNNGQALKWNGSAWAPAEDQRDAFWQGASGNIFYNAGNIGVGTSSPLNRLHVDSSLETAAIFGNHTATTGATRGVHGQNNSNAGSAVYGEARADTGTSAGVHGFARSTSGRGVFGYADTTSGSNVGVNGQSNSTSGTGVYGFAAASSGTIYGVRGFTNSASGYGVYSNGRFAATGTKSFQIDHPLQPETHFLNHFCTEAPEPLSSYSGNVTTNDQGFAVVELPAYFESVNRDFRYQLTVVDDSADFVLVKVVQKISNNRFVIRASKPNVEISWEVKAIRNDRWVQEYGFQTEQEKPEEYKGKYLHPELYGQPKEKTIHHHPEQERNDILPKP